MEMKEDIMKRLDLDEGQVNCIDDPAQIRYLNCVAYPTKGTCDFVMRHQDSTDIPDALIILIVLMALWICLMNGYLLRQYLYTPVSNSLEESAYPLHNRSRAYGSIEATDIRAKHDSGLPLVARSGSYKVY